MRTSLVIAAVATAVLGAPASAQSVTECSGYEMLKLSNRIDFMTAPAQQQSRCIAQQEIMKAFEAQYFKNDDKCMMHMRNAVELIRGRTPADLKPTAECEEKG